MKVKVKIFEDGQEVLSQSLEEGNYKIGRSENCDLQLSDDKVSRNHVELRVTESAVYFTNLSSQGKIYKSGQPIETGEIESGDELKVGPYRLVFVIGSESLEAPGGNPNSNVLDFQEPAAPAMDKTSAQDLGLGQDFGALSQNSVFSEGQAAPAAAPVATAEPPVDGTAAIGGATQLQMKPLVAKLIFTEGPLKGEEIFLETYEVTFGRSKRADIFIDDKKLSRVHAKITRMGMGYRLIDMSSRNGTYVNGIRVLEHPLNSYDVITIGKNKIKFLVHDMILNESTRDLQGVGQADQTKSLQMSPSKKAELVDIAQVEVPPVPDFGIPQQPQPGGPVAPVPPFRPPAPETAFPAKKSKKGSPLLRIALIAVVAGGLVLLTLDNNSNQKGTSEEKPPAAQTTKQETPDPAKQELEIPNSMPKEYLELSPQDQRAIEGHYTSALRAADRESYEEALFHLKKIHEVLPVYKKSRLLMDAVTRRLKEKEYQQAKAKAEGEDNQDLFQYLEDGIDYLKEGDFEQAAEAFQTALNIDPNNELAAKGMKAVKYKVRDIKQLPPEKDPELEKRKQVISLFQQAVAAFANKSYQEAIDTAEQIRAIKLQGDTQYLSEAKQIIDRARMLQKEEFEPFLIQAKEKFIEGDYNSSRDLCEEMLKRDVSYEPAIKLLTKNIKKLNLLAKEAYVTGYILESMGKIEEAKQYWNRAKNYVRPGDEYYDKVMKKLEFYQ